MKVNFLATGSEITDFNKRIVSEKFWSTFFKRWQSARQRLAYNAKATAFATVLQNVGARAAVLDGTDTFAGAKVSRFVSPLGMKSHLRWGEIVLTHDEIAPMAR